MALLELAPVDPRSLIQGDYMALRFRAADDAFRGRTRPEAADGRIVLQLDAQRVARYKRFDDGSPLAVTIAVTGSAEGLAASPSGNAASRVSAASCRAIAASASARVASSGRAAPTRSRQAASVDPMRPIRSRSRRLHRSHHMASAARLMRQPP